jgi:23S rRNA (pseudouridine1915-N3)-methyltransferase
MKIKLIAVGKLKKPYIKNGVKDYIERIKHYIPFEMREIREGQVAGFLLKDNFNVLLDMRGSMLTSEEFASFLGRHITHSPKDIAFFIGGAEGFSEEERKSADMLISLSKMTLPHEVARLVLLEQVYRAFTIMRNEKYHK